MKNNPLIWCVTVAALLATAGCGGGKSEKPEREPRRVTVDADDCLARAIEWGKPDRRNPPGRLPFTAQERAVFERVAREREPAIRAAVAARRDEIQADAEYLKSHPPLASWTSVFGTGPVACARSAWCQELWLFAGPELAKLEAGR